MAHIKQYNKAAKKLATYSIFAIIIYAILEMVINPVIDIWLKLVELINFVVWG